MPIKLKGLLIKHGISRPNLAAQIKQAKDVPLSRPALDQMLNHSYFPRNTAAEHIKAQVEAALIGRGIPAAELAGIWEPDDGDKYRGAHPIGAHVGRNETRARKTPQTTEPDFVAMEIQMLSPLAKRNFKLFRDPFVDDINSPDDIYMSDSQHYVVEAMVQTAMLGGITAAISESGSGKTTLRKLLQYRITRDRQNIRLVFPQTFDKKKLNTSAIGAAIINDIEPDTHVKQKNEAVARQVKEVLTRSARAGFKHVLMIEEAHDLSIDTLKYLKRFNEIEGDDGFSKVLSIVLIAQPELRLKLDANRYPEAREFINRCEVATLDPLLNAAQVGAYLKHKFGRVSASIDSIFAEDAFEAIRARWTRIDPASRQVKSNLYPLIVNNTATRAMNLAAELGMALVTADLIKEL
ncbi:MAG: ExeA family protein [Dechloromonas sp.]|nr:ExeA family protein [Dechloromonas sp.]